MLSRLRASAPKQTKDEKIKKNSPRCVHHIEISICMQPQPPILIVVRVQGDPYPSFLPFLIDMTFIISFLILEIMRQLTRALWSVYERKPWPFLRVGGVSLRVGVVKKVDWTKRRNRASRPPMWPQRMACGDGCCGTRKAMQVYRACNEVYCGSLSGACSMCKAM